MGKDNQSTFADITPGQILDWKARYGSNTLREVTIKLEDEDGEYQFVIRKHSRSVMDAMAKAGAKDKVEDANKILVANCVLGGDMAAFENDGAVYLAVLEQVTLLMGKSEAAVKKL